MAALAAAHLRLHTDRAPLTLAPDPHLAVTRDVAAEVTRDALRDVTRDVTRDAPRDVTRDVWPDVTREAVGDLAGDAPRDAGRDAGREWARTSGAMRALTLVRDTDAWLADVFAPGALGARFQRVRELGRGGMGIVVLARDLRLHRVVALKLLHPVLACDPRARERFRREARIQAQLAHPHIVAVHDHGEQPLPDGTVVPYIALAYVAGESLADRLRRDERLAPREVVRLLDALLDALAYAHGEGIVHRDLKPENVLLADDGRGGPPRPMLTDFGVAARPSHDDPRRSVADAGTPLYMAPEQFAGDHAVDGRTDLYALGAMAYAMLAGRPPFAARSARALAVARLTGSAEPLRPHAPGAPMPLVAAVERCLAADRAERWASAEALRAAFAAVGRPTWRDAWRGAWHAAWRALRPHAIAATARGVARRAWRSVPPRVRPTVPPSVAT